MNKKKFSVRDLCYMGIFAAIIAVCAQVSIPMPYGVPFTLQTFAIPLAGVILGAKKGSIATIIYILLGAMGVPVFAGFTSGLSEIFGRTGGFILAFPAMAFAAGIGGDKNNRLWLSLWLTIGAVITYICGMLVFSFVMSVNPYFVVTGVVMSLSPTITAPSYFSINALSLSSNFFL